MQYAGEKLFFVLMIHRADNSFHHRFQIGELTGRDALHHRRKRFEYPGFILFLLFSEQDLVGGQAECGRDMAQRRHGHTLDAEFDVGTEISAKRRSFNCAVLP